MGCYGVGWGVGGEAPSCASPTTSPNPHSTSKTWSVLMGWWGGGGGG